MSKNSKIKKTINLLLKILISIGSLAYLVYLLGYKKANAFDEWEAYFETHEVSLLSLLLLVLMMVVNWGTEVVKWKVMTQNLCEVSWPLAVKSTLTQIAVSVFTPFRVGGYVGKVALLEHEYRKKGIVLQLFNAMSMFIVTFFFGCLFLGLLGAKTEGPVGLMTAQSIQILGFLAAGVVLVFWVLYVNVNWIVSLFGRFKWTKKWMEYWSVLEGDHYKSMALSILSLSVVRYGVIVGQYVLAYQVFNIGVEGADLILLSGALFFLFQFMPVFNIVELGSTRIAILSFLMIGFNILDEISVGQALAMTLASFTIWLLNLAIPALAGSFYLSKVKVLKEE